MGTLLVERCASADLELTDDVPYGSAALLITDKEDRTKRGSIKVVEEIIRVANKNDVQVTVWVATPCASGCPWRYVSNANDVTTGDRALPGRFIKGAEL